MSNQNRTHLYTEKEMGALFKRPTEIQEILRMISINRFHNIIKNIPPFLSSLRASGRTTIGGRYSDKGMIIFSAKDRAHADSLLSTDPLVPNGPFQADIYPISFFLQGLNT